MIKEIKKCVQRGEKQHHCYWTYSSLCTGVSVADQEDGAQARTRTHTYTHTFLKQFIAYLGGHHAYTV